MVAARDRIAAARAGCWRGTQHRPKCHPSGVECVARNRERQFSRLQQQTRPVTNPKDFGAAGDGRADDTEALQHAIDRGDGVLSLPKGVYRISRPLIVDTTKVGYAALQGSGGAAQLMMTGPGPAIQIVGGHQGTASPSTVKPQTWKSERFPTISQLAIVGAHPEADGIELFRTMQATISQVLVRRCRDGIRLSERNRNFILSDSHIYDNARYGVHFDHCNLHQIILHGNHISYNRRAGVCSRDGDVHNLQITGNDIEYNNRPGIDTPTEGGAEILFDAGEGVISEVTIASNTIQATVQPGGANVRIHGAVEGAPRGARLITLTGNVIGSQTRGIEILRAQRVAISGNTIYDSRERSIDLRHCNGASVVGNTLVWRGEAGDPPSDGVYLEDCDAVVLASMPTQRLCLGSEEEGGAFTLVGCRDCSLSDCQILDPLYRGVELKDCQRCRIANNTIVDRKDHISMRHGVRCRGGSGNVIQNNLVGRAIEAPIEATLECGVARGNVEV